MANFADLVIGVNTKGLAKGERALRDTTREAGRTDLAVKGTGAAFVKTGAQSKASGAAMAAGMRTAALAAAAVAVAMLGVVSATNKFVDGTVVLQAAQAQLGAAITSTGGAANRSQAQLNQFATELQNVTNFGDEAINAMQGVLLTFTQIEGTNFDAATTAVLNVSTAMGTDLKSSALQVGKALNDPVLGMTALSRSGIQFTEAQKAVVKAMVATNDIAGAQGVILDELEKQFGGSAEAARATLGGALTSLGNAWGDLFEVTGPAAESLRLAVEGLIGSITDPRFVAGLQAIGSGLFAIAEFAIQAFAGIAKVIGFITQSSRDLMGLGNTAIQVDAALMGLAGAMEDNITASDSLNTSLRTGTSVSNDRAVASLNELKALQAKAAFGVIAAQAVIRESEAYQEVAASIERSKFALAGLYAAAESGALGEDLSAATQQAAAMEKALIASIAQQQKLLADTGPVGAAFEQNAQLIRDLTAALAQADGEAVNLANTTGDATDRAKTLAEIAGGVTFANANASALALVEKLGISLALAQTIARIGGSSGASGPDQAIQQTRNAFNMNDLIAQGVAVRTTFDAVTKSLGGSGGGSGGVSKAVKVADKATADFASTMEDAGKSMEEMGVAKAQVLIGGIDSVSNAFGDWISNGFKDFKGFANSILDTFKNMLSQMIAMAVKNKIIFPMMGIGTPAAAGDAGGGVMSGLMGGASGLMGGFGTAATATSAAVAGTGFLGGLGSVGSGLMSGGLSGGMGAVGTALGGATTGLTGLAAAAGALVLPVAAAVAVFSFFKTKTKTLDEGIRLTIEGNDALAESYKRIEKSRFFGLSKSESTSFIAIEDDPFADAYASIFDGAKDASKSLGLSAKALKSFSAEISISTKGMTEAEASQAAMNALQEAQNGLAKIFFEGLGKKSKRLVMDGEELGAAMDRISTSVQVAGPLLSFLGSNIELLGISGARSATRFVEALGGLENAGASVAAYMNLFFDAGERADVMRSQLVSGLGDLGIDRVAESMDGYRAQIDRALANGNEGRAAKLISFAPAFAAWATLRDEVDDTAAAAAVALDQINPIFAAVDALTSGVESAMQGVSNSISAAVDRITERTEVRLSRLSARLEAAQAVQDRARNSIRGFIDDITENTVNKFSAMRDAIQSAMAGRGPVSQEGMTRDFFKSSADLQGFASSGQFTQDQLGGALDGVSGDNSQFFGSQSDFAFDFAKTNAALRSLEGQTTAKLTDAERQIEKLDALISTEEKGFGSINDAIQALEKSTAQEESILRHIETLEAFRDARLEKLDEELLIAQEQSDLLLGIDTSVRSVGSAISGLSSAMRSLASAQKASNAANVEQLQIKIADAKKASETEARTQETLSEFKAMNEELSKMVALNRVTAVSTTKIAKLQKKFDIDGTPEVRTA